MAKVEARSCLPRPLVPILGHVMKPCGYAWSILSSSWADSITLSSHMYVSLIQSVTMGVVSYGCVLWYTDTFTRLSLSVCNKQFITSLSLSVYSYNWLYICRRYLSILTWHYTSLPPSSLTPFPFSPSFPSLLSQLAYPPASYCQVPRLSWGLYDGLFGLLSDHTQWR